MYRKSVRERMDIGGYRLIKRIGSGGMSTVFEAEDGAGNRVAFKLLNSALVADESGRARLRREVASLQRVRGSYVAEVLDAETEEDEAFIVTELIDGPTLEQDVIDSGVFQGRDLGELAELLGRALDSVHRAGVLHRDVKPSNVMLGPEGPVLIDFGIAQAVEDSRLTSVGAIAHTPGYLDPRVLDGAPPDEAADWWALAAVLAFAATGRAPFGTGAPHAIMRRVLEGKVDVAGLPSPLAAAFTQALSPHVETRLSYEELSEVLRTGVFPEMYAASSQGREGSEGYLGEAELGALSEASTLPEAGTLSEASADHSTFVQTQQYRQEKEGRGEIEGLDSASTSFSSAGSSPSASFSASSAGYSAGPTELLNPPTEFAAGFAAPPTEIVVPPTELAVPPTRVETPPTQVLTPPTEFATPPTSIFPRGAQNAEGSFNGMEANTAQNSQGDFPYPNPAFSRGESGQGGAASSYPAVLIDHFLGKKSDLAQWAPRWLDPPKPSRWLVFLTYLVFIALSVHLPVYGVAGYAALLWIMSTVGLSRIELNERRLKRGGPYWREGAGVFFRLPWMVLKGLVYAVISLVPGLLVGGACCWIFTLLQADPPELTSAIFAAFTIAFSWFMRTSLPARIGARSVYEEIAPHSSYVFFWTTALAALAAVAFISSGQSVDWSPLKEVPFFANAVS